jgi:methylmalonyl-CoA/ethylmalonyl-CoA epimerase
MRLLTGAFQKLEMKIENIGQIAMPVNDLDASIAFYRDLLELDFLFQAPPGLAFFQSGEVRLMLEASPQDKENERGSLIYFRVVDIQKTYQDYLEKGVKFVDEPHLIAKMPDHELWMVFFHDPSGNPLALMAEIPPK